MVHNNILMPFLWFLLFSHMTTTSTSLHTLAVNQTIRDGGGESLVSVSGITEFGFFSPGSSKGRYLGVWYRNVTPLTVIWVANREKPLKNHSGVLKLNANGIFQLRNGPANGAIIWSSNTTTSKSRNLNNPMAQLMDSGNLVVKNGEQTHDFLWQSFDYPSDTLMSGMKLGWDLEIGLERFTSSWKSDDDPAEGEYAMKLDLRGYPQIIIFKGSDIDTRPGSWVGEFIAGSQEPSPGAEQRFVFNEKEVYYEYVSNESSTIALTKLAPSGDEQILYWSVGTSQRLVYSNGKDECEDYAYCGTNSICSLDGSLPTCECLKGYVPKIPQQWQLSHWKDGCVPRNESNCKNSTTDKTKGFVKYTHMKYPDTSSSWFDKSMNLEECKAMCLRNCSCVAYANLDTRNGGTGCLLWFNYLVDVREFTKWGQDIYVKVPLSELDVGNHGNIKKIVGITVAVIIIIGLITCGSIWMTKNRPGAARNTFGFNKRYTRNLRKEDDDLTTFDFSVLAYATNNFSSSNKLGEGGFGPVYKGILIDGQEIAVKRLSKRSGQGLDEFKNEVALIAKLQHRNLIKLLGCCIQGEETMLIYEYMPNKSLDYFVFDDTKTMSLDWLRRFNIIGGIARGLLYLHQDSRVRIIHRDLKTSNILLDVNLEPKISDFGLARIFLGDQIEENTNRVAGTYGYISPEYAVHGHFSVKSDVFSYGVIVLEIVSGKRNRGFSNLEQCNNLLGYAWRLWTEDRALELVDEVLREQYTAFEVIRSIQVGLLCVQQAPEDRPDMSSVVLMLNGQKVLPEPKVPGFYTEKDLRTESESSFSTHKFGSTNEISITQLDAR